MTADVPDILNASIPIVDDQEPMFNRFCGYIGYRGIGIELTAKK